MIEYAEPLAALRDRKVRFLVVGAFGVNLHAGETGPVLSTQDCDLLLEADPKQLACAVETLRSLGFEIEAGGEPLPDEDPVVIAGIVRRRAWVRARRGHLAIDLPLEVAGADFETLWQKRLTVSIDGVDVTVGPLVDLLRSKELANRPKDRLFLETYRSELEELLRREVKQGRDDDFEIVPPPS